MRHSTKDGFTIVELLIVIVVIAILAVISIVSYTTIRQRAEESSTLYDLNSYAKVIENTRSTTGGTTYPLTITDTGLDTKAQSSVEYTVSPNGLVYCLDKDTSLQGTYSISNLKNNASRGACGNLDGIAAIWTFNGDAQDRSGNGLHGQPSNASLTSNGYAIPNSAYAFNGTNASIQCGSNSLLQPGTSTAFGVSAIVYLSAYPSSRAGIISSGSSGWALSINNSGTLRLDVGNQGVGGLTVPLNTWVTVAAYYNPNPTGSTGSRYSLFVRNLDNSTSYDARSNGVAPTSQAYGATPCYIGSYRNDMGSFLNGSIDDVRFYTGNRCNDPVYGFCLSTGL